MGLKDKLEKVLGEKISGFRSQDSGWYVITRESKPDSNRYQVGYKSTIRGYKIFLHDFKSGVNTKNFDITLDEKPFSKELTKSKPVNLDVPHLEVISLYKGSKLRDNGYLKSKGLYKFPKENFRTRVVTYDNNPKLLLIPYTTFTLYPKPVGAKLINKTGGKFCVKGSRMKGAFHPHSYAPEQMTYILGEGYAECSVARNLIADANVLEVGGCSNMQSVIKQLPEKAVVYVMGENDSKDFYRKLQEEFPFIKVTFPPNEKCKDFGDYFQKESSLEIVKEHILGNSVKQTGQNYKPLGMQDTCPVVYSKVLNTIVVLNPNNLDDVIRICFDAGALYDMTTSIKRKLVNRVFLECTKSGNYIPDNKKPLGLWKKNKNGLYYNDGMKVFEVKKENLVLANYESIIDNDFLLCKHAGFPPIDIMKPFTKGKELEELYMGCDWETPAFGKLLLGFLVQSFYAGVIDFRPHLWIRSDNSHAGKSWLSSWSNRNLIKTCFSRESGRSSAAGTAQGMQYLAGLLLCDEFAEKDTTYLREAKQMIEILRSASTSSSPVVMGTPEQIPKKLLIRFSALLACIEGEEFLKRQDFDRIIFLPLTKKKGSFEEDMLPKFMKFEDEEHGAGFAGHALRGFYLYDEWYYKLQVILSKKYPEIGHKARGLAACIAGYGIFKRSKTDMLELLKEITETSLIEPFTSKEDSEDYLDIILRFIVPGRVIGDMTHDKTVREALLQFGCIKSFGMELDDSGMLTIYNSMFVNFIDSYLKSTPHFVYKKLNKSKYLFKKSNSTYNGMRTRILKFQLPKDDDEDKPTL